MRHELMHTNILLLNVERHIEKAPKALTQRR